MNRATRRLGVREAMALATVLAACGCMAASAPPADAGGDRAAKAYLKGDMDGAAKLLTAELSAGNARASRRMLLARVRFRQEKWSEARTVLDELLRETPDDPQARELLGRTLFRLSDPGAALPYYEEAVRETGRTELRLEMAEVLIGVGRKTDAVVQLQQVTDDSRTWPRAHYLLGKLRLESGLGHWAGQQLWTALRLGFQAADLRTCLAEAFMVEGRITGPLSPVGPVKDGRPGQRTAERILVRVADGGPADTWLAAAPDCALYQAETAITEAGGTVPEKLRLLAAHCWLTVGDAARAEEHLRPVRTRSSELAELRASVALAKRDVGAVREAVKAAGNALPAEMRVTYLLDGALVAQVDRDLPAAAKLLEDADNLLPGRSDVLRAQVKVLDAMGRKDDAKATMRLLAELHPDSPGVRLLAGEQGIDLGGIEKEHAPMFKKATVGDEEGKAEEEE